MSGIAVSDLLRMLARGMSIAEIAAEEGVARATLARELRRMADLLDAPKPADDPSPARPLAPSAGPRGRLVVYTDGASRGNPGPAAIGIVLMEQGAVLAELGQAIGQTTNNVAEYKALITALELARNAGAREVEVRMDSELVVRQMTGQYRVKDERLAVLAREVRQLARAFERVDWVHVRRGENSRADTLANEALDRDRALKSGTAP